MDKRTQFIIQVKFECTYVNKIVSIVIKNVFSTKIPHQWITPIRAHASMLATASGTAGMQITTLSRPDPSKDILRAFVKDDLANFLNSSPMPE